MISYQLAKKLREAGFPQHEDRLICDEENQKLEYLKWFYHSRRGYHIVFDSSYGLTDMEYYKEFPVEEWVGKARAAIYFSKEYLESEEGKFLTVYIPTLSELIEACGDRFNHLTKRYKDGWVASYEIDARNLFLGEGQSPDEAVANLFIALHNGGQGKN